MRARTGLRARVDGGGAGAPRRHNHDTKVSYVGLSMVILCVCAHACTIEEKSRSSWKGTDLCEKGQRGIQKDPHRGILRWKSPCF